MSRPWMKFYPRDWRADPRLRMCSLAARGLWTELIGFMHEAEPYGHLLIDGKIPAIEDIAALVGRPLGETRRAMAELAKRGVYSLGNAEVVYSRRMVRDGDRSDEGRKQAEKRWREQKPNGSPTGSPIKEYSAEPTAQRPDTRIEAKASIARAKPRRSAPEILPEDIPMSPDPVDQQFSSSRGWNAAKIAAEWQRFRNSAISRGKKYRNLRAAWENWVTSPYQSSTSNGATNHGHRNAGSRGGFADNLAETIGELTGGPVYSGR